MLWLHLQLCRWQPRHRRFSNLTRIRRLRLPSVPLVVSDPYFSIWSPYDKLTDGCPTHWTSDEKPLEGILRVDGKNYRFLGAKNTVFQSVVPMGDEMAWNGKYSRKAPEGKWMNPDYNDYSWKEGKGAFGSNENQFIRTPWTEENSDLYVRREFDLKPADLQGICSSYIPMMIISKSTSTARRVAQGPAEHKEEVKLEPYR